MSVFPNPGTYTTPCFPGAQAAMASPFVAGEGESQDDMKVWRVAVPADASGISGASSW